MRPGRSTKRNFAFLIKTTDFMLARQWLNMAIYTFLPSGVALISRVFVENLHTIFASSQTLNHRGKR